MGLFSGRLIFGGAYYRREFCASKLSCKTVSLVETVGKAPVSHARAPITIASELLELLALEARKACKA